MDDFGKNNDYGLKLLIGSIIGIIIILFLVPLGANIIASETATDAQSNAVDPSYVKNEYNSLIVPVQINAFNNILLLNDNSTNNMNINNTEIFFSPIDDMDNIDDINTTEVNKTEMDSPDEFDNGNNNSENQIESSPDLSNMKILSGSITTGSGLNDKSRCEVYVGSEYAGENILMSTLYSRDGSNLNEGRQVSITVDSSGYASLNAADSYDVYPSNCVITIYDSNGNMLDSKSVSLEPDSGTQSF